MQFRSRPGIVAIAVAIGTCLQLACASDGRSPYSSSSGSSVDEDDPLRRHVEETYRAFANRDCGEVFDRTNTRMLDESVNEVIVSLVLLRGFCLELTGDGHEASEVYRELIRMAPLSFSSDDARERLRILRRRQRDPDFEAWVAAAPDRYEQNRITRRAIDRRPANFPPLAREVGIEGFAVVEFGITRKGATDLPIVVESDPPLLFDGAALRAVRDWRYAPDRGNDESQRQVIRIIFRTQDEGDEGDDAAVEAN